MAASKAGQAFGILLAASLALACPSAAAQDAFPGKPVRLIVSWPPGGPLDIIARSVGEKLAASLKQPFIVENRPGAGGNIGAAAVAASPPDGYTLLLTIDTTFTVNPVLYQSMPFKLDALKPLILFGASGLTVGVHPGAGVGTLKALVGPPPFSTRRASPPTLRTRWTVPRSCRCCATRKRASIGASSGG